MGIFDRLVTASLPAIPRFVAGWAARPYIAGETLDQAIETVRKLNAIGAGGTIDLLGEELTEIAECRKIGETYREILAEIQRTDVRSGVSVKLSALGQKLDPELPHELMRGILDAARNAGRFVRIDMEDATTTDLTLDLYQRLRREGYDRVGVVLQARLHRTMDDVDRLAELNADVRLVKGIYVEPESIAWRDADKIRENYVAVLHRLLERGLPTASATHDEALVKATIDAVNERNFPREKIEFQMLLGVRPELRDRLLREGHRLRVYVPFGEQWYPYSMRRLRENPAIAGHVTRAFFGRIFRFGRARRTV